MSSRWKGVELEICRRLGGERTGPVGKDGPDCTGIEHLGVQIKHGKQIPKTIQKWMGQTIGDCPEEKLPLLIMHPFQSGINDSLVVMRFKDYIDWYGA